MRNYDFPAKQRWREWMAGRIRETKLVITPPFRKALLLDPQLLETEMLEGLGYRARNILVVEKDPEALADLRERNEDRKRKGKEQVVIAEEDKGGIELQDLLIKIALGRLRYGPFDHVSLDMLCQYSMEYVMPLVMMAAHHLLSKDLIWTSNLQAKREGGVVLREFDRHRENLDMQMLFDTMLETGAGPFDAMQEVDLGIMCPGNHVQERRDRGEDLKELRYLSRCQTDFNMFRYYSGALTPHSLLRRFISFLVKRGVEVEWRALMEEQPETLERFDRQIKLVGSIARKMDDLAYEEVKRRALAAQHGREGILTWEYPFSMIYPALRFHYEGWYGAERMRLYEYMSQGKSPMLSSFYHMRRLNLAASPGVLGLEEYLFEKMAEAMTPGFRPSILRTRPPFTKKDSRAIKRMLHVKTRTFGTAEAKAAVESVEVDTAQNRPAEPEIVQAMGDVETPDEGNETPQERPKLATRGEIYAVFLAQPDWNVARLREEYDVSAFSDGQLRAYRAWVTMGKINAAAVPAATAPPTTGGMASRPNGKPTPVSEETRRAVLLDMGEGCSDQDLLRIHGITGGQLRAIRAHKTMRTYADDEREFRWRGACFVGRGNVEGVVRTLARQRHCDPLDLPAELLASRNIRVE